MKCSLAEKYIYFKYIFHYNCNLVITTSQISHYNFTNLLCGSINRRICGLDFCYTSCDECVAKVIFTCRCGGGREGGWSEGAELSQRRGSGHSHSQVEPDDCWANGQCLHAYLGLLWLALRLKQTVHEFGFAVSEIRVLIYVFMILISYVMNVKAWVCV